MFFGFWLIYLANFNKALTVFSGVVFVYNGFLTAFNAICLVKNIKASELELLSVFSGYSFLIIFTLIIIFTIHVGLDKKQ